MRKMSDLSTIESDLFELEMQNCTAFTVESVRDAIEHIGYDWSEKYAQVPVMWFKDDDDKNVVSAFFKATERHTEGEPGFYYTTTRNCSCPKYFFQSREYPGYHCEHMKKLDEKRGIRAADVSPTPPPAANMSKIKNRLADAVQRREEFEDAPVIIDELEADVQKRQQEVSRAEKAMRKKKSIANYRALNKAKNDLRIAINKANEARGMPPVKPREKSTTTTLDKEMKNDGYKTNGFNQPD